MASIIAEIVHGGFCQLSVMLSAMISTTSEMRDVFTVISVLLNFVLGGALIPMWVALNKVQERLHELLNKDTEFNVILQEHTRRLKELERWKEIHQQ